MMMKAAKTVNEAAKQRAAQYAVSEEFCNYFNDNMNKLYSLSLWLTASHAKAEQVFAAALEECRKATGVFKAWTESWSRLAVIESAIKIMKPALANASGSGEAMPDGINAAAAPVMRLSAFDRFVYVLSVLDRYSVRDCAILLRCRWQEVERARRRAMEFMGAASQQLMAPLTAMTAPAGVQPAAQS